MDLVDAGEWIRWMWSRAMRRLGGWGGDAGGGKKRDGRRPCTAAVNAGDHLSSGGVQHDILVWTYTLLGRSSGGRWV